MLSLCLKAYSIICGVEGMGQGDQGWEEDYWLLRDGGSEELPEQLGI
jgi:hypothetical protein